MHPHTRKKETGALNKLVWLLIGCLLGVFFSHSYHTVGAQKDVCPRCPVSVAQLVPGFVAATQVVSAATPKEGGDVRLRPSADFGCAKIKNSQWERELCFR